MVTSTRHSIKDKMKLGKNENNQAFMLNLKTLNKHGVISGATGTGKTTTVKKILEIADNENIKTIAIDVKGDLSSILNDNKGDLLDFKGSEGKKISVDLEKLGLNALSYLLDLNDTQRSIIATCLLFAKDNNYKIQTLNDFINVLQHLENKADTLSLKYGRISKTSINTIIRKLNLLKYNDYENVFLNERYNFNVNQILKQDHNINILNAKEIIKDKNIYASLIVYMLQEIYDNLSEVGDIEKPKLLFFIDEAHILFNANKHLISDIIQMVKLIRSKGVGIVFISQTIADIDNDILNQLGLKIQHALRLITPFDYSQARNVARTLSNTTKKNVIDQTIEDIKALEIGRAFIQSLDNQGIPRTERIKIDLPKNNDVKISEERLIDYLKITDVINIDRRNQIYKKINVKNEIEKRKNKNKNQGIIKLLLFYSLLLLIVVAFSLLFN